MGLDQYLYAKKYYSDTGFFGKENTATFKDVVDVVEMNDFTYKNDENFNSAQVEVQCCYWRKANQIHKWFVDNVQNGEDNCAEYYVSREKIKQLIEACEAVISSPEDAEEVLPTESGFFFGSQEYDEWYHKDIEYTAKRLSQLLKIIEKPENSMIEFYYTSSW